VRGAGRVGTSSAYAAVTARPASRLKLLPSVGCFKQSRYRSLSLSAIVGFTAQLRLRQITGASTP